MSADAPGMSRAVCDALRGYLGRHPDAADSPEGIRRWWLPPTLQSVPLDLLLAALDRLVAGGEMQCTQLPDGTCLYAAASERHDHVNGEGH